MTFYKASCPKLPTKIWGATWYFWKLLRPESPICYECLCQECVSPICLSHWGWVTHIWLSKLTLSGSDNGLSPGQHQAIIWTSAGILLIGSLGTNFCEIVIQIYTFPFAKIDLKMLSGKWRPFCQCVIVQECVSHIHLLSSIMWLPQCQWTNPKSHHWFR